MQFCVIKLFTVLQFYLPKSFSLSQQNMLQHFFVVCIVKVWNNLPADVVCASCVSIPVHKLKSVDLSQFLIGNN